MFNSLPSSAATVSSPASKTASPPMEANEKQKAEYQTALSILQSAGITNGQQELQEKIAALVRLECDSSHSSVASTRATSPSSSTVSSEDAPGALARRRGRSVLMLNELVIDLEPVKGPGESPADSISSLGASSGNSTRCTACTPHMMAFSPSTSMGGSSRAQGTTPSHLSFSPPARMGSSRLAPGSALANQVAEPTMMRTSPLQRAGDASQRSAACQSRCGGGDASQRSPNCASQLGGVAAGGDASRRTPIGRVTLGVATIGGDASRRSPPGCASHMANRMLPPRLPSQGCDVSRSNSNSRATPSMTSTSFAALVKDSSRSPSMQDASQRNPDGSARVKLTFDGDSDALKSWLAGASSSSPESRIDLAERLQAAAPESYED